MKVNSTELTERLPQLAFFGLSHSYYGLEMRNRPQEVLLVQRPMRNGPDSYCLPNKHGLRSNRRYFMPSTLAEAMAQLLENTSNEGLHLVKSILTRGTHVLGPVWTDQLTQPEADDLNAINSVLPGLPAQFRTATPQSISAAP